MSIALQRTRSAPWFDRLMMWMLALISLLAVLPARGDDEAIGFEQIPPRLSMVEGEASFWRPGGEEWTEAQVNTPLAAGDQLYTSDDAKLEIQIGPRAFARAAARTQFGLDALEPDYLQLRLTEGDVSLDLRNLKPGQTIEVGTPNAVFTVEQAGYYRLTVLGATSTFISRRGGRASVTAATGAVVAIGGGEQAIVTGSEAPAVATSGADDLDSWDRWNYARTERQIQAVSARYVSSDVYGLADLDEHGDWRQVPTYGAVWVPRRVTVDWAPYSTGRWLHDPFYGWSWVDYSPWGWAPFHYGRWVHVSGFWGWCPGPVVVRPYYAPALVAFYGGPSIRVSIGAPFGWVALGWGEPLLPWWGPVHFRGAARWAGWGGPRVVNRVIVHNTTVINVNKINRYENARVRHGVIVVDRDKFGRGRVDRYRRRDIDPGKLRPVRGDVPSRPGRESMQAGDRPGRRPPRELLDRRVVSPREARAARVARAPRPERAVGPEGTRSARRSGERGSEHGSPQSLTEQATRNTRRDSDSVDHRRRAIEPSAAPLPGADGQRSERYRSAAADSSRGRAAAPSRDANAPAVREQARRDVDTRRHLGGSQVRAERLRPPPLPGQERTAPSQEANRPAVRERRPETRQNAAAPPSQRDSFQRNDAGQRPQVRTSRREPAAPPRQRANTTTQLSDQRPAASRNLQQRNSDREVASAPPQAATRGGSMGTQPSVRNMPRGGSRPEAMRGGSTGRQPAMRAAPAFRGGSSPQAAVRGERRSYGGSQRRADRGRR